MDWPMARETGGTVSLLHVRLEPCVLVLRDTQQRYHGIIGVAVDDIAVWKRRSLGTGNFEAEETFHFRAFGSGKGKLLIP